MEELARLLLLLLKVLDGVGLGHKVLLLWLLLLLEAFDGMRLGNKVLLLLLLSLDGMRLRHELLLLLLLLLEMFDGVRLGNKLLLLLPLNRMGLRHKLLLLLLLLLKQCLLLPESLLLHQVSQGESLSGSLAPGVGDLLLDQR